MELNAKCAIIARNGWNYGLEILFQKCKKVLEKFNVLLI